MLWNLCKVIVFLMQTVVIMLVMSHIYQEFEVFDGTTSCIVYLPVAKVKRVTLGQDPVRGDPLEHSHRASPPEELTGVRAANDGDTI